jgi:hypothetical protein
MIRYGIPCGVKLLISLVAGLIAGALMTVPASLVTSSSPELAASVTGPLLCPAGTTALLEQRDGPTIRSGRGQIGTSEEALLCLDDQGEVVERHGPDFGLLWLALWVLPGFLLVALLAGVLLSVRRPRRAF